MLPEIRAARDIMESYRSTDIRSGYTQAHHALDLSAKGLGHQEALEHLFQVLTVIYQKKALPQEELTFYLQDAIAKAKIFLNRHTHNARMHYYLGSFAITIGDIELAREEFNICHKLSPKRQAFIIKQGAVALLLNDPATAMELFKTAYNLDKSNKVPLLYYNELARM